MKYVVLAIFGVIAATMAYFFFKEECAGKVVSGDADCRAHFSADLCRVALAQADRKARNDFSPFATQDACDRSFPRCMPHASVSGFVPVPRSVCVTRTASGVTGEPIYQRYGQTIIYK